MTKVDPYLHAVLLLHGAGKEVSSANIVAVVKSAGVAADEARAKVLADAVVGMNFEEMLKASTMVQAAPAVAAPAGEAKKAEPKEEKKTEAEAAEGLASLFG